MKNILRNIVWGCLLSAGICLSSCGEEETYPAQKPADTPKTEAPETNIPEDSRILTAEVDELFETTETSTRGIPEETQKIYQDLGNGFILEASAEKDGQMNTRAGTGSTLSGARVLAIIYDAVQDTICKIDPTPTISGNSLTIPFPTRLNNIKTKIVFYSYNSSIMPSAGNSKIGDNINSSPLSLVEETKDVMWATSGEITGDNPSLGTITFKHLFAQVRVQLTSTTGDISSFSTKLSSDCSRENATVNVTQGLVTSWGNTSATGIATSGLTSGSQPTVMLSNYVNIIPDENVAAGITLEKAVLGGVDTPINKSATLNSLYIKGGSRYTIKLTVKRWGIITGWTGYYYQWDAIDPFLGLPTDYTKANKGDNAIYSCALCPSREDVKYIFGQTVYYDENGPEYEAYPNGTSDSQILAGAKKEKYKAGFWLAKKKIWTTTSDFLLATVRNANDDIRKGGNYAFVPASGYRINGKSEGVGTTVYLWTKDPYNNDREAYCIILNKNTGNVQATLRENAMCLFNVKDLE